MTVLVLFGAFDSSHIAISPTPSKVSEVLMVVSSCDIYALEEPRLDNVRRKKGLDGGSKRLLAKLRSKKLLSRSMFSILYSSSCHHYVV